MLLVNSLARSNERSHKTRAEEASSNWEHQQGSLSPSPLLRPSSGCSSVRTTGSSFQRQLPQATGAPPLLLLLLLRSGRRRRTKPPVRRRSSICMPTTKGLLAVARAQRSEFLVPFLLPLFPVRANSAANTRDGFQYRSSPRASFSPLRSSIESN